MRHERFSPSGRYMDVDGKTVPIEEVEAETAANGATSHHLESSSEPVVSDAADEPNKRGRK